MEFPLHSSNKYSLCHKIFMLRSFSITDLSLVSSISSFLLVGRVYHFTLSKHTKVLKLTPFAPSPLNFNRVVTETNIVKHRIFVRKDLSVLDRRLNVSCTTVHVFIQIKG